MGATKVVSDVKKISSNIGSVYTFLSDFRKIGKVLEMASRNPEIREQMEAKVKKSVDVGEYVKDWEAAEDNCSFVVKGLGETGLQFVEKEPNKLLKLAGHGKIPFKFDLWIQLVEKDAYDTRIRLTLHAELNAMMKMMLKNKLEKGINQLVEGLTQIPYHSLQGLG